MLNGKKIIVVMLSLILIGFTLMGGALRFYRLDNTLLTCETHNYLWGFRLHHLSWFNFNDILLDNFFKSFFGTLGGIRYVTGAYIMGVLSKLFSYPLTEFGILAFHATLGTGLIVATYALGKKWGNAWVGLWAAGLVAFNPGAIISSRWDNSEPLVSLTVTLSVLVLFNLGPTKSWLKVSLFSILLSVLVSTESIMTLPLICLYALKSLSNEERLAGRLKDVFSYLFRWPGIIAVLGVSFTLLIHLWVWKRVGFQSHLGMFGLMDINYSKRIGLMTFFPRLWFVFKHYSGYFFFGWFFPVTVVLAVFVGLKEKFKFKDNWLSMSFLGAVFFFSVFILVPNTLRSEHLYICESLNALFISAVWYKTWQILREIQLKPIPVRLFNFSSIGVVVLFVSAIFYQSISSAIARPEFIHPLRSVGYYVRKYGGTDSTVMNLWQCQSVCENQRCEYYYGKQLIDVFDQEKHPRKIFCMGTAGPKGILSAYKMSDFTFYVRLRSMYYRYSDSRNHFNTEPASNVEQVLKEMKAHKVAEVTTGGEVLAEIYSAQDFPYVSMDISEYDKKWASDYAHIDKIIEGPRVGIISTFGSHFDLVRGH